MTKKECYHVTYTAARYFGSGDEIASTRVWLKPGQSVEKLEHIDLLRSAVEHEMKQVVIFDEGVRRTIFANPTIIGWSRLPGDDIIEHSAS